MALPNNMMNQPYGSQTPGNNNWINQFNAPVGVGHQPLNGPQKGWFDTIKEFFLGTPEETIYSSPFTQQQMGGYQQLQQMGLQNQQNPYAGFENIEQGAKDFYNQQLLPSLSERFTGSGGALSSPSFAGQLTSGAQDLTRQLAAQKAQYGQQNQALGLKQAQVGLSPLFQSNLREAQPGLFENINNQANKRIDQILPIVGKIAMGGF